MQRRLAIVVALVVALGAHAPVTAQPTPSPTMATVDRSLLVTLCQTNATTDEELQTCLEVVSTLLTRVVPEAPDRPGDGAWLPEDLARLPEDLGALIPRVVDEAVAAARDTDVQAAIEEALAAADGLGIQALIDAAVAQAGDLAGELDIDGVDLRAAIDELLAQALAAAGQADVAGTIGDGIETTRMVVAAAERWVVENAAAVCDGGALGSAVAAAAVVGYLTGSPGLATRAFEETERATRTVCGTLSPA